MNTDTGQLKDMQELIEEYGSLEAAAAAGFEPVPKEHEAAAAEVLDWATAKKLAKHVRRKSDNAPETCSLAGIRSGAKRQRRKRTKTARESQRRNRR